MMLPNNGFEGRFETEGLIIEYYDKKSVTPLKTTVDTVNKTVSANLAGDGWYYILYLPGYLNIFGYDMPTDGNALLDSNGMYIEAQTYTDLVEEDAESFENVEENADEEAVDTEFETEGDNEDESSALDEDDTVDEIEDIEEKEEDKSEEDILEETEESEFDEINNYSDLKDSKLTNLRLNGFEAEVINVDNPSDANKEKNSNKVKNVNAMVDIVFVFDTTGSMGSAVSKTYKNIGEFADKLAAEGISVSYGLIDYRDITEYNGKYDSRIVKNGYSNWYNTNEGIKNALSGLTIDGGGDGDECALDGLALSEKIGFRSNAQKFIILVTDAASKNDNNFGKTSFDEMADAFAKEDICVSVIAPDYTSCHDDYDVLCSKTNGIYVNIYSDFAKELLKIADKIKENSKGYWIALDTPVPTIIKLNEEPKLGSTVDTDRDTIVDCDELDIAGSQIRSVGFNLQLERAYGGDTRFDYKQLKVYSFNTNPARYDSDGDGMGDQWDSEPLNYRIGMIIYQTENTDFFLKEISITDRKNAGEDNKCPEDWMYQDKRKDELIKMKSIDESYFSDELDKEAYLLEYNMRKLIKYSSALGIGDVSTDIVKNFVDGDGKDFRSEKLNSYAKENKAMVQYYKAVDKIVNEYLKRNKDDLTGLIYLGTNRDNELIYGIKDDTGAIVFDGLKKKGENGVRDELLVSQPSFSETVDYFNGLGICVHGIYGSQIEISSYNESTGEYVLKYTFYDIFGLDYEDIEKDGIEIKKLKQLGKIKFGDVTGFSEWYILQHYNRYKKYKPFLTYVEFEEGLQCY